MLRGALGRSRRRPGARAGRDGEAVPAGREQRALHCALGGREKQTEIGEDAVEIGFFELEFGGEESGIHGVVSEDGAKNRVGVGLRVGLRGLLRLDCGVLGGRIGLVERGLGDAHFHAHGVEWLREREKREEKYGAKTTRLDDEGIGYEGGVARSDRGVGGVFEIGGLVIGGLRGVRDEEGVR